MVITRQCIIGLIEEEAKNTGVLIVNGKEIIIDVLETSTQVKYPFPTIFGRDIICKTVRKI